MKLKQETLNSVRYSTDSFQLTSIKSPRSILAEKTEFLPAVRLKEVIYELGYCIVEGDCKVFFGQDNYISIEAK
jgi:hypothetical protein